jgi:hypothetical protein
MAESLLWVLFFRSGNVLNANPSDLGIECVNYDRVALLNLTIFEGPGLPSHGLQTSTSP